MTCLGIPLITLVVIATSQTSHVSTFLSCRLLHQVRAAAKISAGGVGSP